MKERDEIANEVLQALAKIAAKELPTNYGFVFMTYEFYNEESSVLYASNSNREDVVKAMKTFTTAIEEQDKETK